MSAHQPDEKVCPYCAEVIKAAAVKCRYCQSDLPDGPVATAETAPHAQGPGATSEPAPPVAEEDDEPRTDTRTTEPSERSERSERSEHWARDAQPGRTATFLASARLLASLVILCLVLAAVAGYAWYRSENPDNGAAPSGAITSSQARDAGMAAAAQLTEKVLSYNWQTLDADTKAAEALLAPSFREEYAKTMAGVKDQTIKNEVKLTASAAATSIVTATEKKVVALVFVNQVTTAKGTTSQRVDGSRVLVTLTRGDGDWRISKLKAF